MPGWRCIIPALIVPTIGTLVYFAWLPDHPVGRAVYGALKVFTVVYPAIFLVRHRRRAAGSSVVDQPADGRASAPPRRWFALRAGIASGGLILALILAAYHSPLGDPVREASEVIRAQTEALGIADRFLFFAFWLAVLHSGIEEFYWRWLVFGSLRRLVPRRSAHLLAAAGFAAHHLVVTAVFFPLPYALFLTAGVAVGGLVWSWLFERSNSIAAPWISHFLADAAIMVIGYGILFG